MGQTFTSGASLMEKLLSSVHFDLNKDADLS